MSRRESLLRGAAALALAGLIIKVSNLFVRVPLTRAIGSESLGIYQMALPAFYALYHLAAGGVPIAVQTLVAEYLEKGRRNTAEQVLDLGLRYATLAGMVAAVGLLLGAPLLARLLGEPRTYWALVAVAPAIPLFALDSIYRNYLQGRKLMSPTATASLLEQASKMVVTLVAALFLLPYGKGMAASGAALGITVGAAFSLLYIGIVCRRIREEEEELGGGGRLEARFLLVRRMIGLAWPVTLGSIAMPMLNLLDVGIVQRGFLRAGYPQATATAMYGSYSGIAIQVVWFPFVLTNALANALVPVLAAAKARRDHEAIRRRVLLGLRATGLVCLPVVLGMGAFARPIAALFGEPAAAVPLLWLAPAAYLGPLAWLMTAQLQALGRTGIPMRNFILGLVVKIGLDAFLAPIRGVDVKGVCLANVAMFVVSAWLNARALEKETGQPLPWGLLLKGPLVASLVMSGVLMGFTFSRLLPPTSWLAVTAMLVIAPILYVGTLFLTRSLSKAEVLEVSGPLGAKLQRWFGSFWTWS